MSKSRRSVDPLGTLDLFAPAITDMSGVRTAARFRCGLCNEMGVDEPGELCASCASVVLTKPKATRGPRSTRARRTRAATTGARRKVGGES